MIMRFLKATSVLSSRPLWIVASHIVAITVNEQGKAVVMLADGERYALTDTPDEVFQTLGKLMEE